MVEKKFGANAVFKFVATGACVIPIQLKVSACSIFSHSMDHKNMTLACAAYITKFNT
jgi:hypothetical protein